MKKMDKNGDAMKSRGLSRVESRGSAILIAFFLMAAIGGVAFGIGRIFILDNTISSLYENGAIAYYAAESGVEEGLIRYRFDTGYDLPAGTSLDYPVPYERVDVTRPKVMLQSVNSSDPDKYNITDAGSKFYDLNVTNKAKFYGNDVDNIPGFTLSDFNSPEYLRGEGRIYKIPKDEAIKIDITDNIGNNSDINIFLVMSQSEHDVSPLNVKNSFVEAKLTGHTVNDTFQEYKTALVTPTNDLNFSLSSRIILNASSGAYSRVGLIHLMAGSQLVNTERVELSLKPIRCDIKIALVPTGNTTTMTSPWTTIKSIGYYGDATRTLTAKIDRQSGTVYDLYDFVVYKYRP